MAKRAARVQRTSVGAIHHVETLPGRAIKCWRCGKQEQLQAFARDMAGIRSFNQQVYDWAEVHRACTNKEV